MDAPDDLLCHLFACLLDEPGSFIWCRTTLPLVSRRWAALLREPRPALFRRIAVDARAECNHSKRSAAALARGSVDLGRRAGSPSESGSSPPGGSPVLGSSPMRGGWVGSGSPPVVPHHHYHQHHHQHQQHQQQHPRYSQPPHGHARAGAVSPAASPIPPRPGGSLPYSASASRVRARLSSRRVLAWLQPRAGAVSSLTLDLTGPHDFTSAALERIAATLAPSLRTLRLAGGPIDASDCCEAIGSLRGLRHLEVTAAAPSVLGSGLMQLAFLPALHTLVLSLDIPPACPEQLRDLPASLRSLSLGNMWLGELPRQLAALSGLTSLTLERCSVETNPLPLLMSLPRIADVRVQGPPLGLGPEVPLGPPRRGRRSSSGGGAPGGAALASVALTECALVRVPASLASLSALRVLDVSHNPELGADVAGCLPPALADLPGLQVLAMRACGLGQLPPVAAEMRGLTRLDLAHNPLSTLPRQPLACTERLVVLDAAGTRLKALPGWLMAAGALQELSVSAACLAGPPPGGPDAAARGAASISASLGMLTMGGGGGASGSASRPSSGGALGPESSGGASGSAPSGGSISWLRLLPDQLPGLRVLRIEGALWEQAAVRNVMGLLQRPGGTGGLQLELLSP